MNFSNRTQTAREVEFPAPARSQRQRQRQWWWLLLLGGLLLLAALLLGLYFGADRATQPAPAETSAPRAAAPVEVTSTAAVTKPVTDFLPATGSLSADERSDVAPPTAGQVVATPVDVGAFVRTGAVLARLDDREARLRLQRAQAAEQQAAAALRQAQTRLGAGPGERFDPNAVPEVQAARRAAEAAEAQARLAEANAQRYANLVETGDVARSVYEQYRTQAATARAEANAARQQLEVARNTARSGNVGLTAAAAALSAARAETALAQKAVKDTVITAPLSGYVSDRPIAVGEYVTPSSKIATLVKTNPIKADLQLPEAAAARVRQGLPVTVSVAAYPDRQFRGTVTAINPAVNPESRALSVEAQLANPANLLQPGMFVTAQIVQPGGATGVFVPAAAVLTDPATNTSTVYVLEGETARVRVVQLGQTQDGLLQLVSGVAAQEVVATSNLTELFDGATVRRP